MHIMQTHAAKADEIHQVYNVHTCAVTVIVAGVLLQRMSKITPIKH